MHPYGPPLAHNPMSSRVRVSAGSGLGSVAGLLVGVALAKSGLLGPTGALLVTVGGAMAGGAAGAALAATKGDDRRQLAAVAAIGGIVPGVGPAVAGYIAAG